MDEVAFAIKEECGAKEDELKKEKERLKNLATEKRSSLSEKISNFINEMPNLSNLTRNALLLAVYRTVNDNLKLSFDYLSGQRSVGLAPFLIST